MKRLKVFVVFVAVLAFLLSLSCPATVGAVDLNDILREGALAVGGSALIRGIAKPLDDFLNTVTLNQGVKYQGYTKVVPIVSMGSGTHIGAAQVGGTSKKSVEETQAVAQLEVTYQNVRVKVLVPIDSVNPLQQFHRVQGIGVTAIIDVKI